MLIHERAKLASILQTTADELDIPDYVYEDATLKYEDVADHLAADDSDLLPYSPKIYAQGSFRLGTVVQPYGRDDEYDIDLVCQLEIKKESITQEDLKAKVGKRLKARMDLSKILKPSRRCWLLDYPATTGMSSFHMDVLPSIPNLERLPTGILLTDTELARWQKSNPIAYADWFYRRMEVVFQKRRMVIAESLKADVDDVPNWRVKTPLQRCIQILKRHRDIYFEHKAEQKPVSIILTTLAAHAYNNEEDIFDALQSITKRMPDYIERRNGIWWVQNPVDDGENFADKWNEYPERRIAFMQWLEKVEADFSEVSKAEGIEGGLELLNESLGRGTMDKVATQLGVKRGGLLAIAKRALAMIPPLGNTSHAQSPGFYMSIRPEYSVTVSAGVYFKRGQKTGKFLWAMGDKPVPKNVWLKFKAKTNVPSPYSIRWQVVNTGDEALGDPRGEFSGDGHVKWETTKYRGTHYVEAFVLNHNNVCVARSGKVLVKVR